MIFIKVGVGGEAGGGGGLVAYVPGPVSPSLGELIVVAGLKA